MAKLKSVRKKSLRERLIAVGHRLVDIVAPPRCIGCLQEDVWLCAACRTHIRYAPLACIGCDKAHPRGLTCAACRTRTSLTGVVFVGSYRSALLQRGIGWLKFKGIRSLAPLFAHMLMPRLNSIAPLSTLAADSILVPIPLHRQRQRERGFNQAHEIARHLSRLTGIPLVIALERSRATWTQSHLPPELRAQNMRNVFTLASPLPVATRVILIDDVTTSGATLTAAAQPLLRAGIKTVWGATVAKG